MSTSDASNNQTTTHIFIHIQERERPSILHADERADVLPDDLPASPAISVSVAAGYAFRARHRQHQMGRARHARAAAGSDDGHDVREAVLVDVSQLDRHRYRRTLRGVHDHEGGRAGGMGVGREDVSQRYADKCLQKYKYIRRHRCIRIGRLTSLSARSRKSNWKSGSAVQRSSGNLQTGLPFCTFDAELDVQSGSCLLYAMLMEHIDPTPVELDMEAHVANNISSVPSRSASGL